MGEPALPAPPALPALIILSAGASSRMGRPKALLPVPIAGPPPDLVPAPGGDPGGTGRPTFLAHIAATGSAAGVATILVVIAPPHGPLIQAAHPAPDLRWVTNDAPELGMLRSVQVALVALAAHRPEAAGALIWPVDIPLVRVDTVAAILARAAAPAAPATASPAAPPAPTDPPLACLVIPTHQGRGGHPLWVPKRLFAEVHALPPDKGLRALRQHHEHEIMWLPVKDPGVLRDVDTSADLSALLRI